MLSILAIERGSAQLIQAIQQGEAAQAQNVSKKGQSLKYRWYGMVYIMLYTFLFMLYIMKYTMQIKPVR